MENIENTSRSGGTDQPPIRVTADEEYVLEVNGFVCPEEFITFFTPLEFEELVNMFLEYDANGSGTIDIYEIRKILHHMDMDMSKENAQELMDLIDVDGSGEIDFDEYCGFVALTKRGDEKFTKFGKLLDKLGSTPMGLLEQQAKARHFSTRFFLVEEREATSTTPPLVVIELHVEGTWFTRQDSGEITKKHEVKRFQGMGPDTRHAKDAAIKSALVKLRNYMPGCHYKDGEIPDEWNKWVNDNLCRGVAPVEIIDVLVQKGFKPALNTKLMHKLVASAFFDQFQAKCPDFDIDDMSKTTIDTRFVNWLKRVGNMGIDGGILFQTLEDRDFRLRSFHPFLADKIRYNEFSSLMDVNGKAPKFMDFWQACADGNDTAVELYLRGDMDPNIEKMGRFGSVVRTPLMLAAMGNHVKVCELLIERKANVLARDRRGRMALHLAAMHGAMECCNVLMDAGAPLFAGDNQGNTPLHLATWQNHPPTVDFLCEKGQEFTRSVTADKVAVRSNTTFNQLAHELFQEMQDMKLKPIETRRFQKTWLHDTAVAFRERMSRSVQHMLAPTCKEIMDDVLHRFDPRPETGIFISTAREGEMLFVPTIPSSNELAILLRYMFRQSALDNTNNWNRTPLHLACDENCIASHKETIMVLADKHGCNVMLRDMHGRTPYDLLVMDKASPKNPTATSVREYMLYETREEKISSVTQKFDEEDRIQLENRRQSVLDNCIRRADKMGYDLWEATRLASRLLVIHGNQQGNIWNYYCDPDTKNTFYCCQPYDVAAGDVFTGFTWSIPDEIRSTVHKDIAWEYHRQAKSELVREIGDWITLHSVPLGVTYYFNAAKKEYTFKQPKELKWKKITKGAKYLETYGYAEEWQEFEKDGSMFYYNKVTDEYRWTKPVDAVTVTPMERFCTGYKRKNKRLDQKWYTCDQCNKELKERREDESEKLIMLKICEPCINRCHKGHKGTRLVRVSPISCVCSTLCAEFCPCKALETSVSQLQAMQDATYHSYEDHRVRMHNALMPPIFALCPKYDKYGRLKRESGWTVCRRSPINVRDFVEVSGNFSLREEESSTLETAQSFETVSTMDSYDDIGPESTIMTLQSSSLMSEGRPFMDAQESSIVGTVLPGEDGEVTLSFIQRAEERYDGIVRKGMEEYAARGWVEVLDPEEPDKLDIGARVLCQRQGVVPKCYGDVVEIKRSGIYLVEFADGTRENISSEYIECISRNVFYFNRDLGRSTWVLPPLYDENGADYYPDLPPSEHMELSGQDWTNMKLVASERRTFKEYEEFEDPISKVIFYVNHDQFFLETHVLKLQNFFRLKRRIPRPKYWTSTAFTFNKPASVNEEERIKAGWALLRRRSTCLGEFMDVDHYEWEELMDKETADFFYWQEDMDIYTWDKPEVPKTVYGNKIQPLEVGEKVTFRFPGKNLDEEGVVVRIRQDDSTGEDMYDIRHHHDEKLVVKWNHRFKIKKIAKSGDELKLALSAAQWKKQIRRQREKEKRQRALARRKRQEAEMTKRQKTVVSKGSNMSVMSSASTAEELERARIMRSRAEAEQLREEKDAVMLKKREEGIQEMMKDMDSGKLKLSKSELISLQRSLTLKLEVELLMEKRTAAQNVLLDKRKLTKERERIMETTLRTQEDLMTTPRSSIRRRLLRQLHFAMLRQQKGLVICEWGCGDWVKLGQEQQDHQLNYCSKRIVSCPLDCKKRLTEDEWLEQYEPVS